MNDYFIAMAASVILESVKNPQKQAALKAVMLKIYRTIQIAYAKDPDFTPSAK